MFWSYLATLIKVYYMSFSELIINNNRVYHLDLAPGECAETIITVGDPERVAQVSRHFDVVDVKRSHREFVTHTGLFRGRRLSVISTGIGTDNIDIVLNEVDALFNVDFVSKQSKETLTKLTFIRIGTSGAIADVPVDSFLVSAAAIGLDGLMPFYSDHQDFITHELFPSSAYFTKADEALLKKTLAFPEVKSGLTLTTAGFYAPQGRSIRLKSSLDLDNISITRFRGYLPTNIEMETAGIYALASLLGHAAISFNAILANRKQGTFSVMPSETVDALIRFVLNKIL
ncbi:MAG: nucleoside phosphorylase [Cryomorphaceae bacterium]|nr:nucleoside phosphorylase [Cryomorphaceae bacterium]